MTEQVLPQASGPDRPTSTPATASWQQLSCCRSALVLCAGIVRLLRDLDKQARQQGGAVYMLNGNHESLNVCGDFRSVCSCKHNMRAATQPAVAGQMHGAAGGWVWPPGPGLFSLEHCWNASGAPRTSATLLDK